jgi:glycosyltransferase involved in cell wall biosynthesis
MSGLTTIILTFNEEINLPRAVSSVKEVSQEVVVVDSFSSDKTCEIAASLGCTVYLNRFVNYSHQRNYALRLPIRTEWVLFLDADERLSAPLSLEIAALLDHAPLENGFYIKRRLIWMGKWIRHGYYPVWLLRLFRRGKAACENRPVNEHLVVDGQCGYLRQDIIHDDQKGLSEWIEKHNHYADLEAQELLPQAEKKSRLPESFRGSQAEKKRWIRARLWNRLPLFFRPFLYFFYRYVIKRGFLDGRPGFVFHVLQGFWFPFLIDCKYLESKMRKGSV